MELRHLRYFVTVAEEQNVTRAAARLHVSQPPLSRQIRDLEDELGVALLERSGKSVKLTEAGRVFMLEAKAVLQRADEAVQTVQAVSSGKRGVIHVGYAPTLTVEILPRALRKFQDTTPGIKVELHDLSSEEMLVGLRDKSLHVALIIKPNKRDSRSFEFKELRRYAACAAFATTHPLARLRKISIPNLAGERLIAYSAKEYPQYHEWLEVLFAKSKQRPVIAEEHDSATSLIASVEAGRGIALVSESLACFSGPRLKLKPLTPAPAPFIVGAMHLPGKLTAAVQQFIAAAE